MKPIVTTMGRMFPSVDKLCDAAFMKKLTGLTTKKNALLFIADNPNVYGFFNQMELKMKENNVLIRRDIEQFFGTKDVLVAISSFKIQIKQIEAEQKILKKEQERHAIIEQERDRIVQEEKNRIIAQYHEEQAELAKKKGDAKLAEEHTLKALKLMEKQKEQEKALEKSTTESDDSSHNESDEAGESEEDEENRFDTSSKNSKNSKTSAASSKGRKNEEEDDDGEKEEKDGKAKKQEDEQLDIKRVIEIITATNEANFLLVKHGNKEFKITNLVLDRVNSKLVLNIEPLLPEKSEKEKVKVSFD